MHSTYASSSETLKKFWFENIFDKQTLTSRATKLFGAYFQIMNNQYICCIQLAQILALNIKFESIVYLNN